MNVMEIRQAIGDLWRQDPSRVKRAEKHLANQKKSDPENFHTYEHLIMPKWMIGGPISKRELAEEIGVSLRTVERWDAGGAIHPLAQMQVSRVLRKYKLGEAVA